MCVYGGGRLRERIFKASLITLRWQLGIPWLSRGVWGGWDKRGFIWLQHFPIVLLPCVRVVVWKMASCSAVFWGKQNRKKRFCCSGERDKSLTYTNMFLLQLCQLRDKRVAWRRRGHRQWQRSHKPGVTYVPVQWPHPGLEHEEEHYSAAARKKNHRVNTVNFRAI